MKKSNRLFTAEKRRSRAYVFLPARIFILVTSISVTVMSSALTSGACYVHAAAAEGMGQGIAADGIGQEAAADRTGQKMTSETAVWEETVANIQEAEIETEVTKEGQTALEGMEEAEKYSEYQQRFDEIEYQSDIAGRGFQVIEEQIFPIEMGQFGEVFFIPAFDEAYNRLILLFSAPDGEILYKTEQLETNSADRGKMVQPNQGISAVSFQDLNEDGLMDIVLITSCMDEEGSYAGKMYKVGDVLFQNTEGTGFYRDYRISDKINRFGMNKSTELIASFVRDGDSTEFLYTASTLGELQASGLRIISEQCYFRNFEKLGRLQVVPGVYSISDYDVFMIYLVNEQGNIVWSLQPMGEYDNLYALKGINCRDIDGDGLKDIVVLARYSYEGSGQLIVKTDYSIYYQRTGGFSADTEIKNSYPVKDEDTMEELVEKARAYWGWKSEK